MDAMTTSPSEIQWLSDYALSGVRASDFPEHLQPHWRLLEAAAYWSKTLGFVLRDFTAGSKRELRSSIRCHARATSALLGAQ